MTDDWDQRCVCDHLRGIHAEGRCLGDCTCTGFTSAEKEN